MPTADIERDPPIEQIGKLQVPPDELPVIVNPDRFAQRFSAIHFFDWPQTRPAARVVRASMCQCCIFGRHELCSSEVCTCVCRKPLPAAN